jgi:hypothetical protein
LRTFSRFCFASTIAQLNDTFTFDLPHSETVSVLRAAMGLPFTVTVAKQADVVDAINAVTNAAEYDSADDELPTHNPTAGL